MATLALDALENKAQTLANASASEIAELRAMVVAKLASSDTESAKERFCRAVRSLVQRALTLEYERPEDEVTDETRGSRLSEVEWLASGYLRASDEREREAKRAESASRARAESLARLEAASLSADSSPAEVSGVRADIAALPRPTTARERRTLSRIAGEAFALVGPQCIREHERTYDENDDSLAEALAAAHATAQRLLDGRPCEAPAERVPSASDRDDTLRSIVLAVRARVPVSTEGVVLRMPAGSARQRWLADLHAGEHMSRVESDLRRWARELEVRGVPRWRSVAFVTHGWLIEARCGRYECELWASALLGRDVHVASYRYPHIVGDGDLQDDLAEALAAAHAAAGHAPEPAFIGPRAPVYSYDVTESESASEGDDYEGEDSRADLREAMKHGEVLFCYGDPINGDSTALTRESKHPTALHELDRLRGEYRDARAGLRSVRPDRHEAARRDAEDRGVVVAVSDLPIDGERTIERENGRPTNASTVTVTTGLVRDAARAVLAHYVTREAAAKACGVTRRDFGRWLSVDDFRMPNENHLAGLLAAHRAALSASNGPTAST